MYIYIYICCTDVNVDSAAPSETLDHLYASRAESSSEKTRPFQNFVINVLRFKQR